MDLSKYIISADETILEAMKKIEINNQGFILVLKNNQVYGTLTDGDIRRAIINQKTIQTKLNEIVTIEFEYIYETASFNQIVEKFKSSKINFLPVINQSKVLKQILTKEKLHEILLKGEELNLTTKIDINEKGNRDFEVFNRPWGFYKTIFLSDFIQAKIIHVFPHQQLSLQYHNFREEHWVIVKGMGSMTIGQSIKEVSSGSYIFIPKGCQHRIKNLSDIEPLIISEVQLGTYFGEDDIIRLKDDYGRVNE